MTKQRLNIRALAEELGYKPNIVAHGMRQGAEAIVQHCFSRDRKRIAFINLPGIIAGKLREEGFRNAHAEMDIKVNEQWLLAATRGARYSEFATSLVVQHIDTLMSAAQKPDTILCGNDRVPLEVYVALRRHNVSIPGDVAIASFDNQAEIARRLDPPLTTMALPHREIGRRAVEIVVGVKPVTQQLEKIPFRLIERASV